MAHLAVAIAARYSSCLPLDCSLPDPLAGGCATACLSVGSASWQRPLAARSIARSTFALGEVEEAVGAPWPAAHDAARVILKATETHTNSARVLSAKVGHRGKKSCIRLLFVRPAERLQYIAPQDERLGFRSAESPAQNRNCSHKRG